MKVSVITVCYNSDQTIEDTIKSVINQDYPNIEYIIVDGLSKDNTLEIVNKHKDKIAKIVSEKDNGIYDAINKGIELASGELVSVLNSDDFFATSSKRQCHFRQLGGFARTGFAAHNDHLMCLNGRHDLLAPLADRQVLWEINDQGLCGGGRCHAANYPTPRVHVLHWFM